MRASPGLAPSPFPGRRGDAPGPLGLGTGSAPEVARVLEVDLIDETRDAAQRRPDPYARTYGLGPRTGVEALTPVQAAPLPRDVAPPMGGTPSVEARRILDAEAAEASPEPGAAGVRVHLPYEAWRRR